MKHYSNRLFGDAKYKKTLLHHITIGKKMETIKLTISAFYLLFTSGILLQVNGEFGKTQLAYLGERINRGFLRHKISPHQALCIFNKHYYKLMSLQLKFTKLKTIFHNKFYCANQKYLTFYLTFFWSISIGFFYKSI